MTSCVGRHFGAHPKRIRQELVPQYVDTLSRNAEKAPTINLQKPLLLLHVLRNINLVRFVFDAELFKGTVYFLSVWRAGRISPRLSASVLDWTGLGTYRSMSVLGGILGGGERRGDGLLD